MTASTQTITRITAAEAAADPTGVQVYQASEWRWVEQVTVNPDLSVSVRFAGGVGTAVAPEHCWYVRRVVETPTAPGDAAEQTDSDEFGPLWPAGKVWGQLTTAQRRAATRRTQAAAEQPIATYRRTVNGAVQEARVRETENGYVASRGVRDTQVFQGFAKADHWLRDLGYVRDL